MFLFLLSFLIGDKFIKSVSAINEEDWYRVRKIEGVGDWVELKEISASRLNILTAQHLAFINHSLSFQFPFYGEDFTDLKITTQGFIYLSDVMSDTQYVAPLVANFKPYPKTNPTQDIRASFFMDRAVIQWSNMILADQTSEGQFEFQVQLNKSGTIIMLYKHIPLPLQQIENKEHIVRAGISGGHPLGQTIPIPYSTISLTNITSYTTYILTPESTCIEQTDCTSCTSWSSMCAWCEAIQKCSTGQDRLKDTWIQNECYSKSTRRCFPAASTYPTTATPNMFYSTHSISAMTFTDNKTKTKTAQYKTVHSNAVTTADATSPSDKNVSYSIDKSKTQGTAAPQSTRHPPPTNCLSVIYIILIVASTLSFILVASAILLLLNHKRKHSLFTETSGAQPETNNLLNGAVKC